MKLSLNYWHVLQSLCSPSDLQICSLIKHAQRTAVDSLDCCWLDTESVTVIVTAIEAQ